MRALSFRQAVTCEAAVGHRCKCRCHGSMHGKARSMLAEFFEQLPEEDGHRIPEKSRQLPLPRPVGLGVEA